MTINDTKPQLKNQLGTVSNKLRCGGVGWGLNQFNANGILALSSSILCILAGWVQFQGGVPCEAHIILC